MPALLRFCKGRFSVRAAKTPCAWSNPRLILASGHIFSLAPTHIVSALVFGAIGAAIGAITRDVVVRWFRERFGRGDLGVLTVNLVACVIVALATRATQPVADFPVTDLLVLGIAGGLSTWSTLAVDVAGMLREKQYGRIGFHVPLAFAVALVVYLALSAPREVV